jgi:ABC-type multidrug transport system permease subunit
VIGSPVPLYKSGGVIEILSKLTPQSHALLGYDALLNQGAGLVAVLPQVAILCSFALVFLIIASLRFKYEA